MQAKTKRIHDLLVNWAGSSGDQEKIKAYRFEHPPTERMANEARLHTTEHLMHKLAEIIHVLDPQSYLVIGLLLGTTETFALQVHGWNPRRIVACDIDYPDYNQDRDTGSYSYRNICGTQFGKYAGEYCFLRADSKQCEAINKLGPYDMAFVDGEHSENAVYRDCSRALRCLSRGGIIFVHDLDMGTGVRAGYDRFVTDFDKQIAHHEMSKEHFQFGLGMIERRER